MEGDVREAARTPYERLSVWQDEAAGPGWLLDGAQIGKLQELT